MSSSEELEDNEFKDAQEELEEEIENPGDSPPYYIQADQHERAAPVIGLFFGGLIGGIITGVPFESAMVLGVILGGIGWIAFTRSGVIFRRGMAEIIEDASENVGEDSKQTQVNIGESTGEKLICQNCGWRNPKQNNYCHDCGDEL